MTSFVEPAPLITLRKKKVTFVEGDKIVPAKTVTYQDEAITFHRLKQYPDDGQPTELLGHLETSYDTLCRVFGEPKKFEFGWKIDVEWLVQFGSTKVYIYNWKNGPNYLMSNVRRVFHEQWQDFLKSEELPTEEEITYWCVGGNNKEGLNLVLKACMSDGGKATVSE